MDLLVAIVTYHLAETKVKSSCIESAILTLSRLIIYKSDSINIQYLLNVSEQHLDGFANGSRKEVQEAIKDHKKALQDKKTFIDNLKSHRDQTIAHLDKRYINNPSIIFEEPSIDMTEVEKSYKLLIRILNTYKGYFNSSELYLTGIKENINNDLKYLMDLAEKANERASSKS